MTQLMDTSDGAQRSSVTTHQPSSAHGFSGIAVREAQHVVVFGGTFFSTVIALLSSAFGVVAALAWNKAIQDWLPTIPFLNFHDTLVRDFVYAGVATFVAVVTILILGFVNTRLRTRNPLPTYPPAQTTAGAATQQNAG
jgi:hypothetical protein